MQARVRTCLTVVPFVAALFSAAPAVAVESVAYLRLTGGYWQVWVVAADGQNARPLTSSPVDKTRCSWFADGSQVLVAAQDGRLRVASISGEPDELVVADGWNGLDGALSPSGGAVAYSRQPTSGDPPASGDDNDIWILDLPTRSRSRIAEAPGFQGEPTWGPTGAWVYFVAARPPAKSDLWRVRANGQAREQLTASDSLELDVAVHDRAGLAFSSDRSGSFDLWTQGWEDREPHRLTSDAGAENAPSWSPDGRRLAFESTRTGRSGIWIVELETGAQVRLLPATEQARRPAWSPK